MASWAIIGRDGKNKNKDYTKQLVSNIVKVESFVNKLTFSCML